MSNNNTNATVTLTLNGQQALQQLNQLRQNALQLETAIAKAAAAGNKADLKRLRKELTDTRKQIREIESSTQQVETVMKRLNKATPTELNRTLQTLNRQLQYIERGTPAWDAHVAKIKRVKAELATVNAELKATESTFQRMNRVINEWGTTIMGATAALTGFVMAGRSAVEAFAEMDEALANTRKFTGLSVEGVQELNEEFKKMNTRTAREELNAVAQEAGRLGKNTKESIMGYVEAADILNVALSDLGEGATQTIAKIANIFGVEQQLGTKQSMLAIGSAVNVLSQNCTAGKPYLVEFAQRMAGIGAQAGLTVPQILAFGAVLDSNGQKVEMSATAIQKVLMNLANNNKSFAATVGLDAKKLKETLETSAVDGLMMFLGAIRKIGEEKGYQNATMSLAPAFKEMGLDAARTATVLSTLAGHLDEVKEQLGNAQNAFDEATSATHEFEIFNNTTQAGLDKARKRVSELAIELGEKLVPIMRHVYSSSSLMLRLLSSTVSFIVTYKREIVIAAAALLTYNIAINASNILFKLHYAWIVAVQTAQKVGAAVMATYKTAVLMVSAAYNKMTGNATRAAAAQKLMNATAKANIYALLATAIVALGVALYEYKKKLTDAEMAEKEMNALRADAAGKAAEEAQRINTLRDAAMNEKLSLDDRRSAIEQLNAIIPDYNAFLDKTTGKYEENKEALDKYIESLIHMYEIEGAKDKLKEIGRLKAETTANKKSAESKLASAEKTVNQYGGNTNAVSTQAYGTVGWTLGQGAYIGNADYRKAEDARVKARKAINEADRKLKELQAKEDAIRDVYGEEIQKSEAKKPAAEEPSTTDPNAPGGTIKKEEDKKKDKKKDKKDKADKKEEDKFKAENEWRQREQAQAMIDYGKGEKNYEQYTNRMNAIEVEFNEKRLAHTNLSSDERLTIESEYYSALIKQRDTLQKQVNESEENERKQRLEQEETSYSEAVMLEKQRYVDGKTDLKTYEDACHLLELEHLRTMVSLTKEGTKERLEAESAYTDALLADQKERQKAYLEAEKKHMEDLQHIKESYFGNNANELKSMYMSEMAALNVVYNAEIAAAGNSAEEKLRIEEAYQKAKVAIAKKYNQKVENDGRSSFEKGINASVEWLESEGGQAMMGAMNTIVSGMSSIFSGLSSLIQAETEIQTAAIEKKYDSELSLAEGNAYKEAQLEKEKEKEIAAAKKEANRKLFAMQVIQAVASTALSAINAYSSAAQVPMIGYILAPIAAAMALAAGAIQIASIKRQQQASEAQGYSSGGYTPPGRKDEEVGVVHAGEWVASQELLSNPVASHIIQTLDTAQRTNTIGALRQEDVSRSITAPIRIAESAGTSAANSGVMLTQTASRSQENLVHNKDLSDTMRQLTSRLSEPFVTINTVDGDHGIKAAQDEYNKLIRNKSPKSRR